jgi:uncharacterized protein
MDQSVSNSDGEDAPYWDGLAAGKLMLPRCAGCKDWRWPAGHRCAKCGTTGMDWVEQPMTATVFSWTRTWHRFALTESFDLPFVSIIAELDGNNIRLMGRLEGLDTADPAIGEPIAGRIGATRVGTRDIPTIIWSRAA